MNHMDDPTPALIEATRADGGLIFLSHIEERPDHSTAGLDGMEIYNRHADAKRDMPGPVAIMLKLTAPATLREFEESLNRYPDELFAAQADTRETTSPSGIRRRRRGGSPAWPRTTVITTTSCW